MIEDKIEKWLLKNNPSHINDVYDKFPRTKTEVVDHVCRKYSPYLLTNNTDNMQVAENQSKESPNNEDTPKKLDKSEKKTTIRQQVMDDVYANPQITPGELYEKYPTLTQGATRRYKADAVKILNEISKKYEKEQKKKQKHEKADETIRKLHKSDNDQPQKSESLNFSALEKRAHGEVTLKTNDPEVAAKIRQQTPSLSVGYQAKKQLHKRHNQSMSADEMMEQKINGKMDAFSDDVMIYIDKKLAPLQKRIDELESFIAKQSPKESGGGDVLSQIANKLAEISGISTEQPAASNKTTNFSIFKFGK